MKIFIPGSVPSSKNGKQWTGHTLISSKATQKYYRDSERYWYSNKAKFLSMIYKKNPPYKVVFKFVRGSRHKFDYINPAQTIQDLMVKYKWLEDDNADLIIPIFAGYEYDKENPGVWISVID